MVAIVSLLVVILVSLIITRIAAMALMLTGLSRESARFQARSAFTGVGFTTAESEHIANHPVRRRIIMTLMLIGNAGIVTVLAAVMASLVTTTASRHWGWHLLLLAAGLAVIMLLASSRWVEHRLNILIAIGLRRWTRIDVKDYVALLQLQDGYAVTEMKVEPGDWLADKSLQAAALTNEGILVLGILRPSGSYLGSPRGTEIIHVADTLVLYGQIERLAKLDERRAGQPGDAEHLNATAAQQGAAPLSPAP